MKLTYRAPEIKVVKFDTTDIIQTSGLTNVDTSDYGFKQTAQHSNQGQKWLDIWN